MKPFKAEQPMDSVPRTPDEAARQKGHLPVIAVFLAIGLALAFIAFFMPAAVQTAADQF